MAEPNTIADSDEDNLWMSAAALYWRDLTELKSASLCISLYRDDNARRARAIDSLKAITSSASIAGWALWHQFGFIWATIIVVSQFVDAIKDIFPFSKIHASAASLSNSLDILYSDAELEWENICARRHSDISITRYRAKLGKRKISEEHRFFPQGVDFPSKTVALAAERARAYLQRLPGVT